MRVMRIILPALVALALAAGCNEQKQPAPEAQKQAQKAPEQTIEAAKPAASDPSREPATVAAEAKPGEVKPVEAKPAEVKPVEAKPAEASANPSRDQARGAQEATVAAEAKPAETKADLTPKSATVAATEPYVLPELEKIALPDFNYPKFEGRKMSIVFTGNVIGEIEPCG